MNKNSVGVIVSLVFALITAGSFYWLWIEANKPVSVPTSKAKNYTAVEIEAVKTQANDILSSLEKNSDIPLTTPTAKMGRVNPFIGL
jgi:hypothetical protein